MLGGDIRTEFFGHVVLEKKEQLLEPRRSAKMPHTTSGHSNSKGMGFSGRPFFNVFKYSGID